MVFYILFAQYANTLSILPQYAKSIVKLCRPKEKFLVGFWVQLLIVQCFGSERRIDPGPVKLFWNF